MAEKSGGKRQRVSVIAAFHQKQIIAPLTFEGHCNTAVFAAWIEQFFVPCLNPGETVVMDNASFHKSKRIRMAIENAGCRLIFLPPYSPDFNPIEHEWSPRKNTVRKNNDIFFNFRDAVDDAFRH